MKVFLGTMPAQLCGPCHRERHGTGYPSMALPTMERIDIAGGVHGLCDGHDGRAHRVHLDRFGEPMTSEAIAAFRAGQAAWDLDVVAGHSLCAS